MKPVTMIVIGCGGRGTTYADYAAMHPDQARVVGAADPREFYRNHMAAKHGIPGKNVAADWRPLADRPRFADAVLICTPDQVCIGSSVPSSARWHESFFRLPPQSAGLTSAKDTEFHLGDGPLHRYCRRLGYWDHPGCC